MPTVLEYSKAFSILKVLVQLWCRVFGGWLKLDSYLLPAHLLARSTEDERKGDDLPLNGNDQHRDSEVSVEGGSKLVDKNSTSGAANLDNNEEVEEKPCSSSMIAQENNGSLLELYKRSFAPWLWKNFSGIKLIPSTHWTFLIASINRKDNYEGNFFFPNLTAFAESDAPSTNVTIADVNSSEEGAKRNGDDLRIQAPPPPAEEVVGQPVAAVAANNNPLVAAHQHRQENLLAARHQALLMMRDVSEYTDYERPDMFAARIVALLLCLAATAVIVSFMFFVLPGIF